MYFPFFRARQFELIALRELLNENSLHEDIIPVLEPVKEAFTNLNLAHRAFQEKSLKCYLIVNPFQGESSGDTEIFLNYLAQLDDSHFVPAFLYSDNKDFITGKINKYNIEECMLIGLENFSDDEDFRELCLDPSILHIMVQDPNKFRSLDRYIKGLGKSYIRLDDVFEKQKKNADFLDIVAHKFTEEHLYYKDEQYNGFADFTVLPSEFVDGGSTPRAVVIHFTYLNEHEENQIWIRHFTSDTTGTIANVQGKFYEAARKMITFCDDNGIDNSAVAEIRGYLNYDNGNDTYGRYPGLGIVKKISIKNHLTTVGNFLLL